jgi:hypothetical protein
VVEKEEANGFCRKTAPKPPFNQEKKPTQEEKEQAQERSRQTGRERERKRERAMNAVECIQSTKAYIEAKAKRSSDTEWIQSEPPPKLPFNQDKKPTQYQEEK